MNRRRATLLRGSAVGVISFIAAAVVLEAAFRVAGPFVPGSYQTAPLIEYDGELGWRNIPGAAAWVRRGDAIVHVAIGEDGSFGPSRATLPSCRVVLVGDSYLAPVQVPFEQSAARILRGAFGQRADVVDRAVSGYGTDQELLFLESGADGLRPDVVVLFFAVANDVWNDHWPFESRAPTGPKPYFTLALNGALELHRPPAPGWSDRVRAALGASSLITIVRTGVLDHLAGAGLRSAQLGVLDPATGEWRDAWRVTDALISRLGEWSRSSGVPVVLVIGPDPCQVETDRCAGRAPARSPLPQERLALDAKAVGLPAVDLLPAFTRGAAAGMFAPGDIHWSAAGHAVAAREVAPAIAAALPTRC